MTAVAKILQSKPDATVHTISPDASVLDALQLMAEVEVRVKKRVKRNGRVEDMGELAIQFGSLEALNGLIDRLRG